MQPRQRQILKYIVREFCQSGEPVGSLALAEKYTFEYSPATIRGEMSRLERKGFLEQPHTSAGRVPTDKGLRFFVEELMEKSLLVEREKRIFTEYVNRFMSDQEQILKSASKALARVSRNLGFGVLPHREIFYGSGYADLIRGFAEEDFSEAADIFSIFESGFEKKFFKISRTCANEVKVFIGEENPIKEFKKCSLLVGYGTLNDEEKIFIGILGPKKMNYSKNISLIKELTGWLEKRNRCPEPKER